MMSPSTYKVTKSTATLRGRKDGSNQIDMRIIQETDAKFDISGPQTTTNGNLQTKSLSPTRRIKANLPSTTKNTLSLHNKGISFSLYTHGKHLRGSTIELVPPDEVKNDIKISSEKNSTPASRSNSKTRGISRKILCDFQVMKKSTMDLRKIGTNYVTEPETKTEITDIMFSPYHKSKINVSGEKTAKMTETLSTKALRTKSSHFSVSNMLANMNSSKEMTGTTEPTTTPRNNMPKYTPQGDASWSSLVKRNLPVEPEFVLKYFDNCLSPYEKTEILSYQDIYYIADLGKKLPVKEEKEFDDEKGDYLVVRGDQFKYRYEVIDMLGRGSFGQVVKVFDHKRKEFVALKVIRSQKKFHFQAKIEVKILKYMMQNHGDDYNIMDLRDNFLFRNHVVLIFDLLSINLYDFLKKNKFKGLHMNIIRKFAIQILYALKFLNNHKIIHCDLKPENILLKNPNKTGVKLIDFGSSCFENEKLYTYIQSRFYRSPEVILGFSYTTQIDMWSFGCLLCELYTGTPIFPGESEHDQLLAIMELCGVPERHVILHSPRRKNFFDDDCNPIIVTNSKGKTRTPGSLRLAEMLKCTEPSFVSLVKGCLLIDPHQRLTPNQALAHEWILEGLPPNLQEQHLKLIEFNARSSVMSQDKDVQNTEVENIAPVDRASAKKRDRSEGALNSRSSNRSKLVTKIDAKRNHAVQQSMGDLSSVIQKSKISLNINNNAEEDPVINITINLNEKNKLIKVISETKITQKNHKKSDPTVANLVKESIKVDHVPEDYHNTEGGELSVEDRHKNEFNYNANINNFSLSSTRRRKFLTTTRDIKLKENENSHERNPSRDTKKTLATPSSQKSLAIEKKFGSTRNISTPKTTESIGKFIQESRKETFFTSSTRGVFPTLKSPASKIKLM